MKQAPKAGILTYAVPAMMTICILMLSWQSARPKEQDPIEMTTQGVISENIRATYAREIEACYHEAGKAARGARFVDCLKQRVRTQENALEAIYSARMSYLESSPELATSLQNAQTVWLQYRDANCAFVKLAARAGQADESFQNCLLRTTIYRRLHLRWSIGD
jgi:uncharacterized protein YecT (DUF1311 family)